MIIDLLMKWWIDVFSPYTFQEAVHWPASHVTLGQLEVKVAQKILSSELLVQEDEDFISNFILTEEAIKAFNDKEKENDSSFMGNALFFSGSFAAAAAAFYFISERGSRLAAAASVLPAALAAATAATQSGRKEEKGKDKGEQFDKLVEQLLADMRLFKQLVRKSLNLLQGKSIVQNDHYSAN